MASGAGWNGFAGHIWPTDCSMEAPGLGLTQQTENVFKHLLNVSETFKRFENVLRDV